jgi:hypothetical protein
MNNECNISLLRETRTTHIEFVERILQRREYAGSLII